MLLVKVRFCYSVFVEVPSNDELGFLHQFLKIMYLKWLLLLLLVIVELLPVDSGNTFYNITRMPRSFKKKRGLIFEGGGVAKMIYGAIYPIYLYDRVKWRQLNCGYNIQAQYAVPTTPTYWWEKWDGRSLREAKEKFERDGTFMPDESRKLIYIALETFMNVQDKDGHKCLLRSICENGEVDEVQGIFAEILYTILKPGINDIDTVYMDAYNAGRAGANCLTLFPECPKGHGIFDSIAVTLSNWN